MTQLNHPLLTPDFLEQLKAANRSDPRDAKMMIRQRLKVKKTQQNEWYRKIFGKQPVSFKPSGGQPEQEETPPNVTPPKASFSGDAGVAEAVDHDVRTLEDLLKVCEVDLSIWEVERYVVNKWATARKHKTVGLSWVDGVSTGHVHDHGTMKVQPLYQVKAWLKKKREATDFAKLAEIFLERAEQHAPKSFKYQPVLASRDCLYVLNIQDLHLAKLAWGRETRGADYDIKIAERVYHEAVDDLMRKVPSNRVEEVVVIVGSDFFQIDNDRSETTRGTYVDSDSRVFKAFEVGTKIMTETIEKIANQFKVRIVTVCGNHDATISQYLGFYVSAWFRSHPNVTVDNSFSSRKYVPYGKTLITFDHGDEIKLDKLPLTMMRENQSTVSNYKYFEVLTGHLHHEQVDEYSGVKVRIAPALCPADSWHSKKGLIGSVRQSQGLLYQRDNGLEAIFYSTPLD